MRLLLTTLVVAAFATPALALEVKKEKEIAATPDKAWAAIGEFCAIAKWHPVIASCETSTKDGATFRTLTTKDGAKFLEKLTAEDKAGHSYSYAIVESPLPVANYVSTLAAKLDDDGDETELVWSSTFDAKGVPDDKAKEIVGGIYEAGLDNIAGMMK